MTTTQYRIANFLKKFGILKKTKRLNDAAVEIQLMRQAEDILARHVWPNIEGIDKYKSNYWNLKKMIQKKEEINLKTDEIQQQIDNLKKTKEQNFEDTNSSGDHDLQAMLSKQSERVKLLKRDQEDITKVAGNIRRLYEGTILKIKTLKEANPNSPEAEREEHSLFKLKDKFSDLKAKKLDCDTKLAKQTAILNKIADSINAKKSNYRDEATENYEVIGKANKTLSTYRSQLGLLEAKIVEHYAEIGNKIGKEYFTDRQCREAAKDQDGLCKIIKALRLSIDYNYELSGR